MKIQDLNISAASKSALNSIGLTMVSELAGQNYITLINKFPKNYNIEPLISELNTLGYLLPPSDEISIYDVSMSKRLQNALIRNGVMYLSQLSRCPDTGRKVVKILQILIQVQKITDNLEVNSIHKETWFIGHQEDQLLGNIF